MGRIRIGLSGWDYASWRGDVYPPALPRSEWLHFVAHRFDTLEVNSTFYGLAAPERFRRWYEAVPPGFVFAVKGSRYITHVKKFANVDTALANFLASGLLELDDKLGPVVWQLPERLHLRPARIDDFLAMLPHDTISAAAMARGHDDRVEHVSYGSGARRRMRHVLEVRHPDHLCEEVAMIARRHGVALAVSDAPGWSRTEEVTAGFVYVRLHGATELYVSPYGEDALGRWADRLRCWSSGGQPGDALRLTHRAPPPRRGRDVYVYFDNTARGHAYRDATVLRGLVGS